MTLKELKDFINTVPDAFNDYKVETAEYMGGNEEDVKYSYEKPVIAVYVREDTEEVLIMTKSLVQIKDTIPC